MPVREPPGTIVNFGAFDKNTPIYTTQVDGFTVLSAPPKKMSVGGKIMFELIDMVVLGGVSEMAIAAKASQAGMAIAEITELITEYTKLQSLGTDIAKTTEAVTNAQRVMNMAVRGAETVGEQGAKVAEVATEMFPKTARLIAKYGTVENASIGYKIYDKTKTGLDLLNKVTEDQTTDTEKKTKTTGTDKNPALVNDLLSKLREDKTTTVEKNSNYVYPGQKDLNKVNTPSKVPITSNTAVTHIATKKPPVHNWIDQRDYNNFNFYNQTPRVNQDWLQVNQNNVENIDGEKLQNFVEDN